MRTPISALGLVLVAAHSQGIGPQARATEPLHEPIMKIGGRPVESPAGQQGREQAGNLLFLRPPGWRRQDNPDGTVLLVPPDAAPRDAGLLFYVGRERQAGETLQFLFDGAWQALLAANAARVVSGGGIRTGQTNGVELLFTTAQIQPWLGPRTHVAFCAAAPGTRIEAVLFTTTNRAMYERHIGAVNTLVETLRFANVQPSIATHDPDPRDQPAAPAPEPVTPAPARDARPATLDAVPGMPAPAAVAPLAAQPNALRQLPGSIVYIAGGNIWHLVPSTGARRQVTTDGGYRSPSLADDGTVGAVQRLAGRSHFVTIKPMGQKTAFAADEYTNVVDAQLSPDGQLFAYSYQVVSPLRSHPARVGVTFADRWAGENVAGGTWGSWSSSYYHGRWMTDERLILSGNGSYPYLVRGARVGWDDYSSPYMVDIPGLSDETYDVSRNGARLLVVGATWTVVDYEQVTTGWHAVAYRPARAEEKMLLEFSLQELRACRYDSTEKHGGGYCVPEWIPDVSVPLQGEAKGGTTSPDGRALAFADARGLLVTEPLSPTARAFVVDPEGSEPEWGPYQPGGPPGRARAAIPQYDGFRSRTLGGGGR
jgi:hypothetical protein